MQWFNTENNSFESVRWQEKEPRMATQFWWVKASQPPHKVEWISTGKPEDFHLQETEESFEAYLERLWG